jgi:hypothetical protein
MTQLSLLFSKFIERAAGALDAPPITQRTMRHPELRQQRGTL